MYGYGPMGFLTLRGDRVFQRCTVMFQWGVQRYGSLSFLTLHGYAPVGFITLHGHVPRMAGNGILSVTIIIILMPASGSLMG